MSQDFTGCQGDVRFAECSRPESVRLQLADSAPAFFKHFLIEGVRMICRKSGPSGRNQHNPVMPLNPWVRPLLDLERTCC